MARKNTTETTTTNAAQAAGTTERERTRRRGAAGASPAPSVLEHPKPDTITAGRKARDMAKNHRAETVKTEIRQRMERYTFNAVARWTEAHEIAAGPEPDEDPNRSLEIRRALRRLGRRPEV